MFANKMLPEKDFGAYVCWSEKMFNRTHGIERKIPNETLDANIYFNHPAVRFNREKYMPDFDADEFKCTLNPVNKTSIFLASQRLA
uniref:Uncharacterized protein n=1 Tax=Panagrolaimus davidi TaxID=227884 RepID=A0A914PM38_9BILA